jgi:hypothetical protein
MSRKQRKSLKQKRAKLTHRQLKLLRELPQASSGADAARRAGYSPHRANQSAYQAIKGLEGQINGLLERHGLTDDAVIDKYLLPLMNATETKFFVHQGKVISRCEVIAWGARAKGLDILGMIKGWYKSEQDNTAPGVRVVVINAANRPPRDPAGRIITPPALPGSGHRPSGEPE